MEHRGTVNKQHVQDCIDNVDYVTQSIVNKQHVQDCIDNVVYVTKRYCQQAARSRLHR